MMRRYGFVCFEEEEGLILFRSWKESSLLELDKSLLRKFRSFVMNVA